MTNQSKVPCAECGRPVHQRPDGRWQHAIPKPADPKSALGDVIAAAEYGRELALWSARTTGHLAQLGRLEGDPREEGRTR